MKTFFTNFTRGMLPLLLIVAIGFKLDGLAVELFCLFLIFLVWDLKQHMTSLVAPRINLELIGGEPLMPVVTAETLRRGFSERELDACAGTGGRPEDRQKTAEIERAKKQDSAKSHKVSPYDS
jgi:hypothetical protein